MSKENKPESGAHGQGTPKETLRFLRQWMMLYQNCVRNRDYKTGATLFHEKAVAFDGQSVAPSLEQLEAQWSKDWHTHLQFTFDLQNAKIIPSHGLYVIGCEWKSEPAIVSPHSKKRHGYATVVLAFFPEKLLCLHMNFNEVK